MTTTWKSNDDGKKSTNQATNNTISGAILSSWSRQQKLAMVAGFAILGLLLAVSACSKESSKPALVGVSSLASTTPEPAAVTAVATIATAAAAPPAPRKKAPKKRPADVAYIDANSGVSFLYPRKALLISGGKVKPEPAGLGDVAMNVATNVSMNFIQPGGVRVATVALPAGSYRGTDFAFAFFNVNVNRRVSEQECEHFAVVDTSNADGEPVDAEKVKIGSAEMEMTSDFSASAIKQDETQYYHSYENNACYEYVLGLGTAGFATEAGIEHVNRDEVFSKLEKILGSVTIKASPVEPEPVAEQAGGGIVSGKE
jgi:hypothetical protein